MKRLLADDRGFSLLELIIVAALMTVLGSLALGVSNTVVKMARAESGAQQLDSFLRRYRETAVSRRRDIEIRFTAPNQVSSLERAVPDANGNMAAPTPLETMTFEGSIRYLLVAGLPDTPNLFGNATAVSLGGANPVMFCERRRLHGCRQQPDQRQHFPRDPG